MWIVYLKYQEKAKDFKYLTAKKIEMKYESVWSLLSLNNDVLESACVNIRLLMLIKEIHQEKAGDLKLL